MLVHVFVLGRRHSQPSPLHKRVATLPCEILMSAFDNNVYMEV